MGYLGPLTSVSYSSTMSHQTPPPPGQRIGDVYTGDMANTTALAAPRSSIPQAVTMDHYHHPRKGVETAGAEVVDAADVLLCDLGNKAMVVEDLENALRLWTKPAVLIAGRNSLDGLPSNVPETILYLDLSWNRCVNASPKQTAGASPNDGDCTFLEARRTPRRPVHHSCGRSRSASKRRSYCTFAK